MKSRQLALVLTILMGIGSVCGEPEVAKDRPIVACSTTQVADFARQIAGDDWDVRCVLDPGQDPHMYQLQTKATDLVRNAALCFDNGMHLEGNDWMRTVAKTQGKPIVSCTDGIKPLQLEENGETVADPHAWFSPENAVRYVRNIHKAFVAADPKNKIVYDARASLYLSQLKSLDAWAKREINKVPPKQRVLVTSHDAFNYFCDAFGFKGAAPVGWSTAEIGGNVTPESRKLVVQSIRDAGVPAIFVETSVNGELIRGIAKEAGVRVGGSLYSDSMGRPGTAGEDYIGMMRENVITIVSALTADAAAETTAVAAP